jgi:hypothetical protein
LKKEPSASLKTEQAAAIKPAPQSTAPQEGQDA